MSPAETGSQGGDSPRGSKRRRHSYPYYLGSVPRKVWTHPANRHGRSRALLRAFGWQLYKRVVHRPVVITPYAGLKLKCYPDSTAASDLFYFGSDYEYDEMTFLRRYLRPDDVVIDGGANIGSFTLFLVSLVRPGGRVIAIEPGARAAARLQENVDLNGLGEVVCVVRGALADKEGTASFTSGWDVSNRIVRAGAEDSLVAVRTVALDGLLDDVDAVSLAKLDLEGGEYGALQGAEECLRRGTVSVWMIEAIGWRVREAGASRQQIFDLLVSHGYVLALFDAGTGELTRRAMDQLDAPNFFAVHADAWDSVQARLAARPVSR